MTTMLGFLAEVVVCANAGSALAASVSAIAPAMANSDSSRLGLAGSSGRGFLRVVHRLLLLCGFTES